MQKKGSREKVRLHKPHFYIPRYLQFVLLKSDFIFFLFVESSWQTQGKETNRRDH